MSENTLAKLNEEPKTLWIRLLTVAIVVSLVVWGSQSLSFSGFTSSGINVAKGLVNGLLHPNTELIFDLSDSGIPFLILQTIAIAVLGTIIGAILAIPVSFLASTNIVPKPIAMVFRAIILLIRTIPALIWALVWIRVTGPGAFCGVVTQSVCSIGMISKMYITAIEDLNTGILESLDAAGCTTFQKIRCGILPQLSASFISTAIYRFDINLKDATILGIVGAGGIGSPLNNAISAGKWSNVGAFLLTLIVLVIIIEYFSTKVRARLAHGRR
ncbi:MAG: phosphonate ABC transporter, permease protein PhnE [Erysipelotrichaceae bacterium]|nr:phosphonate ABC transporter, permease protein PhnE [Erysipelotrichaceae bacterium]MDY6034136.1 phosphonate ABC transporter, permease protein PhnE [Bulleidia sp.]